MIQLNNDEKMFLKSSKKDIQEGKWDSLFKKLEYNNDNLAENGVYVSIPKVFQFCYENVPNFLSKMYHIPDWAFDDNSSAKELILPNTIAYIGLCPFHSMNNLEYLYIPDSVDGFYEDGIWAFVNNCKKLKKISLPGNGKLDMYYEYLTSEDGLEEQFLPSNVEIELRK